MNKHFLVVLVLFFPVFVFSQNVGIGTTAPEMKLHIMRPDSALLLLENTEALDLGINTSMYFKTGNGTFPYTGGIKSIGTGPATARLSLFTYASPSANGLIERFTILDNGYVGIGTLNPGLRLEVEGGIKADSIDISSGLIKNVADPISAQDAATKAYVDGEITSLPTITTHSIGDFAYGGVVFWVDETGQHGLVCAKNDQSSGVRWYAGSYGFTRAFGDHIGAGKMNIDIIIGSLETIIGFDGSPYAAEICKDLVEGGYDDWYLPSKEELNLMYQNKSTIDLTALANGGSVFSSGDYWSSTEAGQFVAWGQNFTSGNQEDFIDKNENYSVRAIRDF